MTDKKTKYFYNGEVVYVVDGDTLDIKVDLGFNVFIKVRVRIVGPNNKSFDAPELRLEEREKGLEAKELLEEIFEEHPSVTIQTYKTDKYGRWVAEVWPNSITKDVASLLVEKQLGEWYE